MAITSSATTPEPFLFLDLPIDIRVMVYERLPRSTSHLTIDIDPRSQTPGNITLISHSTSTAILSTCHQVHEEALPFVNKAIREWVEGGGVKIISNTRTSVVWVLRWILPVLLDVYNDAPNTRKSKPQLMQDASNSDDAETSYILDKIARFEDISAHDIDKMASWIAKSAKILTRRRSAIGIMAPASEVPSVEILFGAELGLLTQSLLAILSSFVVTFEKRTRRLAGGDLPVRCVGFIHPAYLHKASITPYAYDLQQSQNGAPLLTAEEWYRTWK